MLKWFRTQHNQFIKTKPFYAIYLDTDWKGGWDGMNVMYNKIELFMKEYIMFKEIEMQI